MANKFDDISKGLAAGTSRRGMFKVLGVGVAGAIATAFRPKSADAATNCLNVCKSYKGTALAACMSACACSNSGYVPCGIGAQRLCCSPKANCYSVNGSKPIIVNGNLGLCVPIPDYSLT